ncbi:hypothetical protein [Pseudoalteromonas distincta]|uniref:Uncharacterized protein n=1 Tax=Pseudoalteromonas distincta TaxID=77608 RepID=A0A4P9IZ95_9GAMM|nr:hypothetical protein [Pseudoalteromonas distincta]QCU73841.1 hypothetical protein FFU37_04965 [Pseudoalteromonas distincta]
MNEFFTLTTNLSPHAKWILIRLIIGRVIGDEVSKVDFIELGCSHNKFKKVVDELLNINAISKLKTEHFKKGRPVDSYIFVYDKYTEMSKLLPSEKLTKIEDKDLRVPIKIVWCFFVLNEDEFGHVENFSVPTIANACGIKPMEVKTAVTKLKEQNFIIQITKGCTYKQNERFTYNEKRANPKRPSAYLVTNFDSQGELNMIQMGKIRFYPLLEIKNINKHIYKDNFIKSLCLNLDTSIGENSSLAKFQAEGLTSIHIFKVIKLHLAKQPKSVLDNLYYVFLLLLTKSIKGKVSIQNVHNSLTGTSKTDCKNSTFYKMCLVITSLVNTISKYLVLSCYTKANSTLPFNQQSHNLELTADAICTRKYLFIKIGTCKNSNSRKDIFFFKLS